ncbi:hypothetical protein VTH06DRAFT_4951 [Thermothelomyces fergusii]
MPSPSHTRAIHCSHHGPSWMFQGGTCRETIGDHGHNHPMRDARIGTLPIADPVDMITNPSPFGPPKDRAMLHSTLLASPALS